MVQDLQVRISQHDAAPIDQQLISRIKLLVACGRLIEGEQLPLAEILLINPNTVAQAYRDLEPAAVVVSRRASGVFVSAAGSPLSRRKKNRLLNENIDALLTEAVQLGFGINRVDSYVRQRSPHFHNGKQP